MQDQYLEQDSSLQKQISGENETLERILKKANEIISRSKRHLQKNTQIKSHLLTLDDDYSDSSSSDDSFFGTPMTRDTLGSRKQLFSQSEKDHSNFAKKSKSQDKNDSKNRKTHSNILNKNNGKQMKFEVHQFTIDEEDLEEANKNPEKKEEQWQEKRDAQNEQMNIKISQIEEQLKQQAAQQSQIKNRLLQKQNLLKIIQKNKEFDLKHKSNSLLNDTTKNNNIQNHNNNKNDQNTLSNFEIYKQKRQLEKKMIEENEKEGQQEQIKQQIEQQVQELEKLDEKQEKKDIQTDISEIQKDLIDHNYAKGGEEQNKKKKDILEGKPVDIQQQIQEFSQQILDDKEEIVKEQQEELQLQNIKNDHDDIEKEVEKKLEVLPQKKETIVSEFTIEQEDKEVEKQEDKEEAEQNIEESEDEFAFFDNFHEHYQVVLPDHLKNQQNTKKDQGYIQVIPDKNDLFDKYNTNTRVKRSLQYEFSMEFHKLKERQMNDKLQQKVGCKVNNFLSPLSQQQQQFEENREYYNTDKMLNDQKKRYSFNNYSSNENLSLKNTDFQSRYGQQLKDCLSSNNLTRDKYNNKSTLEGYTLKNNNNNNNNRDLYSKYIEELNQKIKMPQTTQHISNLNLHKIQSQQQQSQQEQLQACSARPPLSQTQKNYIAQHEKVNKMLEKNISLHQNITNNKSLDNKKQQSKQLLTLNNYQSYNNGNYLLGNYSCQSTTGYEGNNRRSGFLLQKSGIGLQGYGNISKDVLYGQNTSQRYSSVPKQGEGTSSTRGFQYSKRYV